MITNKMLLKDSIQHYNERIDYLNTVRRKYGDDDVRLHYSVTTEVEHLYVLINALEERLEVETGVRP